LLLAGDTWIPKDADLVKIETFFVRVRLGRRQIALGNGHSLSRLVGWHAGTAGYIVSKTGAQRLLKRTRRLRAPIDSVIFNPSFIACASSTIYQLTPALCAQSQFVLGNEHHPTLIQHEVLQRRKDLLARISSHASRLFAHFRNGTLFANENVPSVAFGHRDGMSISIGDSPRIQMSAKARGRRS
jgi:glycosyl transferase family 25